MIMSVFHAIVINSLVCLGIHVLTRVDMLLWPLIQHTERWSDYIKKPLFDCPPCMASIWGAIGYIYFAPDINAIPYLLALCGFNALLSNLYYLGWEHTKD